MNMMAIFSQRASIWIIALLLAVAVGFGVTEATRLYLEHTYKKILTTDVKQRAFELTAQTMQGNVMGSVADLGLVNQAMKSVVQGKLALQDPVVMDTLQAVGNLYQATGVYVVNSDGIIQSCWYTVGRTLTGVDVKFRPYFQIAMQGKQNIYAAIGTTTGQPALYFAAPLYGRVSSSAPVIGVAVARLNIDRVESMLKTWHGHALLLSPQQITFASSRDDWVEQMAGAATPEQLKAIRELKQFGNTFEKGTPKMLPFNIGNEIVNFDHHRYSVARAPVQWNDPHGDWTLVLMGDLDELMPAFRRAAIGVTSGTLMLALSAIFMVWRRRLQHANKAREQAEAEMNAYATRMYFDSETKSYLAEVSADLQQAVTLEDFARKYMLQVTTRMAVDYGAFYVFDNATGRLVPVGGHGVLPDVLEKVAIGQGLVGQCAKDMAPIEISDVADTEIRIIWGEGSIAPKRIILLPVMQTGQLLGVIVFAALQAIGEEQRALLDAMMPMVAMNLEILERNLGIQRQAEILQQQQTQMQETEAWYRGIIESAPEGMLVADGKGVIILANQKIDAMFGYSSGALIGQNIGVLVPAAVRAHHPGLVESYTRQGITRSMGGPDHYLCGVHSDGSEFPVDVGLSKLPALGGQGTCVCASVLDVTERREHEREMSDMMALQRVIFDNIPASFFLASDGVIRQVNPWFVSMLGGTEDALVGQPVSIIFRTPEAYAAFDAQVAPLIEQGLPASEEIPFDRADGRAIICRVSVRPVHISGTARSAIWLLEDIAKR